MSETAAVVHGVEPDRARVLMLRAPAADRVEIHEHPIAESLRGVARKSKLKRILKGVLEPVAFPEELVSELSEHAVVEVIEPDQGAIGGATSRGPEEGDPDLLIILSGEAPALGRILRPNRLGADPRRILLILEPPGDGRGVWSDVVGTLHASGMSLPFPDPGPGCVLAFDADGRGSVYASECTTASDYVLAVNAACSDIRDGVFPAMTPDHPSEPVGRTGQGVGALRTEWVARFRAGAGGALFLWGARAFGVGLLIYAVATRHVAEDTADSTHLRLVLIAAALVAGDLLFLAIAHSLAWFIVRPPHPVARSATAQSVDKDKVRGLE